MSRSQTGRNCIPGFQKICLNSLFRCAWQAKFATHFCSKFAVSLCLAKFGAHLCSKFAVSLCLARFGTHLCSKFAVSLCLARFATHLCSKFAVSLCLAAFGTHFCSNFCCFAVPAKVSERLGARVRAEDTWHVTRGVADARLFRRRRQGTKRCWKLLRVAYKRTNVQGGFRSQ